MPKIIYRISLERNKEVSVKHPRKTGKVTELFIKLKKHPTQWIGLVKHVSFKRVGSLSKQTVLLTNVYNRLRLLENSL